MSELAALMGDALEIMLIGMISVFSFLALLVWLVSQMGHLVQRWAPQPAPQVASQPVVQPKPQTSSQVSPNTVAAITAAVHSFRQQHQKNLKNPTTSSPQ